MCINKESLYTVENKIIIHLKYQQLFTTDTVHKYNNVFVHTTFMLTTVMFYIWRRDVVVDTVTLSRATQPRNRGSTSRRGNRIFSSPGRPEGLCGPPNLLYNAHRSLFTPR